MSPYNLQTTDIITDRVYKHFEHSDLFSIEQKGCRRGSYGCKDQLLINKMILENCHRKLRNLSCAWIDYKKAFDSVPHSWILKSLNLFKVSPTLISFLKHNMKQWKTHLFLSHENGMLKCENIDIKRGIFQGDSLSPLLFCIALIPLSMELNRSGYGYKLNNNKKISHLFYMDDLKLFCKDDSELEGLLKIVKSFSDDIGMEFGLSKCAKASFKRGRKVKTNNLDIDNSTLIREIDQEEVYKYLGVNEGDGIQHASMKEKIKKEVLRRIRLILKAELNSKNRITAINTLALPVATYSFNIIDWNLNDIKRMDVKIRKLLTANNMHHPKADVDRLYLPRNKGGRGMIQLEMSYKTSTIGLNRYFEQSQDWIMNLVLSHERNKTLHSVVKEARKYCLEIDLNIDKEFEENLSPTMNAKKLKQHAKNKRSTAIYETWKSKPLHGQYANRSTKADVDTDSTHQLHRAAGLTIDASGGTFMCQ